MKVNSLTTNQTNRNQNFRGGLDSAAKFIAKHPALITSLAGASVVAQKIVMSGSEAVIGPAMDIGIGKAITKATKEENGRTNQASKTQAIRTFSQSVGGTITGVIIRCACIAASTFALSKAGEKAGNIIAQQLGDKSKIGIYKFQQNAQKWGKNVGGAVAIGVMMFTNFLIDAPFINWINKKATGVVDKFSNKSKAQENAKEVK